ncbi:MAG: histidine kinase [Rhodospirillaceae bacterium]|nr:histidine kinase [Rhodospirillaceae bacterium]MBL6930295.1 histidine kinase [Rhodospirillales bacterium]MBL6940655.1 histidine kinase [Rhodospirillales bacterium]
MQEQYHGHARDRVRARILYPFALVILFVVGAFLVAAYLFENREHEKNLTESAASVERLFRQGLENDSAMMQAALTVIARDDGMKKAFLARDRESLLKLAWPLFDNLRTNNRVSHFYFTDPNRVNFLRVHKPDEYGDTINRITTLRAAEVRVPARGIELGPLGTFTLRAVLPWYEGETLIGFLELGEEIDHITDAVHETMGADLLVLVYEQFLGLKQWETGKEMLGHKNDWPRFGNSVVVGRSMKNIPGELAQTLNQGNHTYKEHIHVIEDGKHLYITFLPLNDISGQEVGDFIVVRDVTGAQVGFQNAMILTASISVLVGSIVFAIFYAILGTVERDYRRQREIELQLSRINTEHQKVIQVEKLSAMGLMVGEIAHQLNNPLVGVVNMAQLAERKIDDPARIRELLYEIGRAGKDCHAFVKRMLEFTKIASFDRKPTDINMLIEETVSLFHQSVSPQQKIVCDLPEISPILGVDPVLIGHALFNLITNAAQVSPPGGTITISLSNVAQLHDPTPGWSLAVADEGPGLSDEVMEKMFTPFFTTRAEGTGLGLPVVQHVAIIHEGRIIATNLGDGGAYFALWLPVTEGSK